MEMVFVIAVLLLVTALVFSLMRRQQRILDREQALTNAPLDTPDLDFGPINEEEYAGMASRETKKEEGDNPGFTEETTRSTVTPDIETGVDTTDDRVEEESRPPTQISLNPDEVHDAQPGQVDDSNTAEDDELHVSRSISEDLPRIRQLRDKGELRKSERICLQHLPRAQAFQQLLITQRQEIRHMVDQGMDATPVVSQLYRTAFLGELYRSSKKLPASARTPAHARLLLRSLPANYQSTGYEALRSLTKTDRAFIEQLWGAPDQHQAPAATLPEDWWTLTPRQDPDIA